MLCLVVMLLANFAISIWNAYAVGKVWVEARAAGGWPRLLCWAGAIQSACGFTWCYLIVLGYLAYNFGAISQELFGLALNLGYAVIMPGIVLSGLAITLDSWGRAFRQGGFMNYGLAFYNTYAQIHNTYYAISSIGEVVRGIGQLFGQGGKSSKSNSSSGDGDGVAVLAVILLVAVALVGGILTTMFIIWRVAGTQPLPPRPSVEDYEMWDRRRAEQVAR